MFCEIFSLKCMLHWVIKYTAQNKIQFKVYIRLDERECTVNECDFIPSPTTGLFKQWKLHQLGYECDWSNWILYETFFKQSPFDAVAATFRVFSFSSIFNRLIKTSLCARKIWLFNIFFFPRKRIDRSSATCNSSEFVIPARVWSLAKRRAHWVFRLTSFFSRLSQTQAASRGRKRREKKEW